MIEYVLLQMNKPIRKIIDHGESETLEFKTSFSDEVIVSLVAFANTRGRNSLYWRFG